MDAASIIEKINSGKMSEHELTELLSGKSHKTGGSFLKTILKGFLEGYTAPVMWRMTMEMILIFLVIAGIVTLSILGRIDAMITSVLLAFVLGFLFGKIK
jgi:hypothetical protein